MTFPRWITGGPFPQTIERADLREERLRTLRTRLSAAYKGVHALLMRCGAEDFRSGQPFDQTVFFDENVDIHHVFPEAWCKQQGIKPEVYNSIINKTPLSARNNRIIGSVAAFAYLARLEKGGERIPPIATERLKSILRTHQLDVGLMRANNFDAFFNDRRERLLKLIETAMGKPAVREDIAPPDPDDSFGEDEQEAELMEASEKSGCRLMARSPRSSNGKPSKQVDALKHNEATRRNIPTAEMESFFRREEDPAPRPPKHYPRHGRWPRASGEPRRSPRSRN